MFLLYFISLILLSLFRIFCLLRNFFPYICILFLFHSFVIPFFFLILYSFFPSSCVYLLCTLTYTFKSYYFSLRHIILVSSFKTLQRATIAFFMSAHPSLRPSVRTGQLGSHWKDFHEMLYGGFRSDRLQNAVALSIKQKFKHFTWTTKYVGEIFLGYEKF